MLKRHTIQVFEHQTLRYGREYKGVLFSESQFQSLVKLNELHQNAYFTTVHKGIKFSQYVGVIQVEGLTIEVLPKINAGIEDTTVWRDVLIQMLRATKKLNVKNIGEANVQKQQIHLLDIYFEWYLNEMQLLIRQGLIKQYYSRTANVTALKGKLQFAGHISKNLVHKERFYTTHQVYEKDHAIHQILGKALDIVAMFTKGHYLYSRCKTVQLDFPKVSDIKITPATFAKIPQNRKTAPYKTAISLARFILLNYAPNISSGSENMLALLFDMNQLWEEYILIQLKKAAQNRTGIEVYGQRSKRFWKGITIRPDIVMVKEGETIIIDTKWKDIKLANPSTDDLRQMYVYNDYWSARKAMLLYPAIKTNFSGFTIFEPPETDKTIHQCGIGQLSIFQTDQRTLNQDIGKELLAWME